ncbi:iron uptake system protein EfeO [Sporolactobacillus laevolacticus]|uniref:iron uptake system protein EfeO n=1 Tax=Sporolactobacillus laevolacticus TaxID=33018 RepID=UPI0025B344C4|nr:iron uptake system protein EfeO [Sporolactobacillus laevolacticus]MDN3955205.1 iron uptake system protein EfeO [Sporolactobacillus laevolacticus]
MNHQKKIIFLLFIALLLLPVISACSTYTKSGSQKTAQSTNDPVKQGTTKLKQLNNELQVALKKNDTAAIKKYGKQINTQWLSYENGVRDRFPLQYAKIERYQQPIYAQSNLSNPDVAQMKENSEALTEQLDDLLTAKETKAKPSKQMDQAVNDYLKYADEQIDMLVKTTKPFVKAVEDGDIEKAKKLYTQPRIYYERAEPIAESFGDLDPAIDARINDVDDPSKWTGFHEIERALWEKNSLKGQKKYAQKLMADVLSLQKEAKSFKLTPKAMVAGAMELLEEAATTKITGEEERYSHTDLVDLQANVDGSEAVYQAAIPALNEGHKDLAAEIDKQFQAFDKQMLKYKKSETEYENYTKLSKDEIRKISNELSKLSKLMAQTAKIF